MVSLRDQIRKLHRPSRRELGLYGLKRLKRRYDVDEIDHIISDWTYLIDSGLFDEFFEVYINWKDPIYPNMDLNMEISEKTPLLYLANECLNHNPFSDLIDYASFYFFYPVLEWVYSMYLNRSLEPEDLKRLFLSDVGERVVFGLENFDKIEEIPHPTLEFFQDLKSLNWQNEETKRIHKEILKIITFLTFESYGKTEAAFDGRIYHVILFIAGCNAVKNERNNISFEDIVKGHKTLCKLIKMDIVELITESSQKRN